MPASWEDCSRGNSITDKGCLSNWRGLYFYTFGYNCSIHLCLHIHLVCRGGEDMAKEKWRIVRILSVTAWKWSCWPHAEKSIFQRRDYFYKTFWLRKRTWPFLLLGPLSSWHKYTTTTFHYWQFSMCITSWSHSSNSLCSKHLTVPAHACNNWWRLLF